MPDNQDFSSLITGTTSGLATATAGGFNPVADAIGIGELLTSISQSKKAKALTPTAVDPMEQEFYNNLDNLRKGYTTGAAFNSYMKQLKTQTAAANSAIVNRAGGYGGGAIAGLEDESGIEGDTFAKLMADAEKERLGIVQAEGAEGETIASRKYDLQTGAYANELEKAANNKQSGFSNLLGGTAGTANFFPALLKLLQGGGTTPTVNGTTPQLGIGTTDPNLGVGQ
jgi:hypothetical protein